MALCACGCGQENRAPRGQYRWGHRPKETLDARDRLCACGCGQPLPTFRNARYYAARYLRGHGGRGKPSNRPRKEKAEKVPCACGCGELVQPPVRFRVGHASRLRPPTAGLKRAPRLMESGYVLLFRPDHPGARKDGYIFEHRLIWEAANARNLLPTESVHHINGIRDDNRPENLVALTRPEHQKIHQASSHYTEETRRKLADATRRAWAEGRRTKKARSTA